jgi:hypothetical protein
MTRRIQTHEQCLKDFVAELKREIKSNVGLWRNIEPREAAARRAVYCSVLFVLRRQLESHGIPLADVGLVDYEVPRVPE